MTHRGAPVNVPCKIQYQELKRSDNGATHSSSSKSPNEAGGDERRKAWRNSRHPRNSGVYKERTSICAKSESSESMVVQQQDEYVSSNFHLQGPSINVVFSIDVVFLTANLR